VVVFNDDEELFELNHQYAYATNNPLIFIDQFGLNPETCGVEQKDKKDCKKTCKSSRGRARAICLLICSLFSLGDDNPKDVGRNPRPDQEPTPITAPKRRKKNPR
jgi:hypothetical protein